MKQWFMAVILASAAGPGWAQDSADPQVGHALDALGLDYTIDSDGDYKLVLSFDDGRSQLVFVRSVVHSYKSHRLREIWAPGYRAPIGQFPADVANRLLEDANDQVLGSWVKQGPVAMFVVKVDADTYGSRLHDAISAAAVAADTLEEELTGADEF